MRKLIERMRAQEMALIASTAARLIIHYSCPLMIIRHTSCLFAGHCFPPGGYFPIFGGFCPTNKRPAARWHLIGSIGSIFRKMFSCYRSLLVAFLFLFFSFFKGLALVLFLDSLFDRNESAFRMGLVGQSLITADELVNVLIC